MSKFLTSIDNHLAKLDPGSARAKFRKFKYGKFGLKEDPRHAHVVCKIGDRTYLGEVLDARRNEVTGCVELVVRHFCGEMWSFNPSALAVDVLVYSSSCS